MRKPNRNLPRIKLSITNLRKWSYRPNHLLYEKSVFEFNPYDDDDHPSVPHGDQVPSHHFKIDLRNGDVWEKRERIVGKLKKKDFLLLQNDPRIKKVIIEAQKYYAEQHPGVKFDAIPWMSVKSKTKTSHIKSGDCSLKTQ